MLACKVLYYNTKTKLDLTKLFLLEVSQLQVQIYGKYLKKQKYKGKKHSFTIQKYRFFKVFFVHDGKNVLNNIFFCCDLAF